MNAPRRPRRTDEQHFRGDLLTEEEKKATNTALEVAGNAHQDAPTSRGKDTAMSTMIDPTAWNLDDIPDAEVLDDGDEVKVSIVGAIKDRTKKTNAPYLRIILEVPDRPLVKEFSHMLFEPNDDQTPKQNFETRRRARDFFRAFNLRTDRELTEADLIGETAWCIVSMKEDQEYGKQNQVRKWIPAK